MEDLGLVHQLLIPIGGHIMTFNLLAILMTWIVILLLVCFGYFSARQHSRIPAPLQVVGELLVSNLYALADDALDEKLARKYAPMICALFMFLALSNWLGILPHLEEPTKDLNTPLSLALMGFIVSHFEGIRTKGFKKYIAGYFDPFFFMLPLNIIGELAKVVSISFRLFGNIMGGSIIIMVISHLCYNVAMPPFLNLFFGLFVGSIQAFVFTMLTVVYISIQVK